VLQVVYVLLAVFAVSACSSDPRDGGAGTTAGGSSMAGSAGDGAAGMSGDAAVAGGSETDAGSAGGDSGGDSGLDGSSGDGGTDPCENIGCNDGNDCTADRCVDGFCYLEPVQVSGVDCDDGFFEGQGEPGAGVCLVPCGAEDQECCDNGASGCRSGLACRPVIDGGSGMACVTE